MRNNNNNTFTRNIALDITIGGQVLPITRAAIAWKNGIASRSVLASIITCSSTTEPVSKEEKIYTADRSKYVKSCNLLKPRSDTQQLLGSPLYPIIGPPDGKYTCKLGKIPGLLSYNGELGTGIRSLEQYEAREIPQIFQGRKLMTRILPVFLYRDPNGNVLLENGRFSIANIPFIFNSTRHYYREASYNALIGSYSASLRSYIRRYCNNELWIAYPTVLLENPLRFGDIRISTTRKSTFRDYNKLLNIDLDVDMFKDMLSKSSLFNLVNRSYYSKLRAPSLA